MVGLERKQVEALVETLATIGCRGESVAEVAHDARNMVTALGLYCDLLEEPGVLATPFTHYGSELRPPAADWWKSWLRWMRAGKQSPLRT
jgi:hypothetical protein